MDRQGGQGWLSVVVPRKTTTMAAVIHLSKLPFQFPFRKRGLWEPYRSCSSNLHGEVGLRGVICGFLWPWKCTIHIFCGGSIVEWWLSCPTSDLQLSSHQDCTSSGLSPLGLLGQALPCRMWNFSNSQLCLEDSPSASLKLFEICPAVWNFLPSLLSFSLFFHRYQTSITVWNLSLPTLVSSPLFFTGNFPKQSLAHLLPSLICFSEGLN